MKVQAVADRGDALRSKIPALFELSGTPRFEPSLFESLNTFSPCRHLTAFVHELDGPPSIAIALNEGVRPVAVSVANKYTRKYWRLDPINKLGREALREDEIKSVLINTGDIDDGDYRRDCYTSVGLHDRLTVMRRRGIELMRLNIYSGRRGFQDQEIDMFCRSSDLLFAALDRHIAHKSRKDESRELTQILRRLAETSPQLSSREAEVCSYIICGMSTEAISLTLDISKNTVQTYRKRAYARLGISTQNELMRLVLH